MTGNEYKIKRLSELISKGESVLGGYDRIGNIDQHDLWFTEVRSFLKVNAPGSVETLCSIAPQYHERLLVEPYGRAAYELIQEQIEVLKQLRGQLEEVAAKTGPDMGRIRILFLAANPTDTPRLRLGAEARAIESALAQAEYRDRFEVNQQWALRATDIQRALLRHEPDIVHFSGHGSKSNAIILEDDSGRSHPIPARALSRLFSVLRGNIRCVILNACYTQAQAEEIAKHIDCVVGMSKAIGDAAAISFATAFYQALGYGKDVQTAFALGCVQIDLENLDEQDTPQLLAKKTDPRRVVLVGAI